MKKSLLIISIIISAFVSCTTDVFELDENNNLIPKTSNNSANKITEADALDIAGKIFHKTRSIEDYSIEYVLNDNSPKTRSIALPDTLAYILNFGNNNGFAVISSDNRIFPLLAFSDTGHFRYEKSDKDPVYVNFISLIDDYMATIDESDTVVVIPDDYLSTCVVEAPQLKTKYWNQWYPFNKYTAVEHPDCPVGCVAIAAGQIMANCKDEFVYHDSIFKFKAIREAMDTTIHFINNTNNNTILVPSDTTTYSYETAVDKVARFLYFLCDDLNMQFDPEGSGAFSWKALNLLKNLGFQVNEENGLRIFSDETILDLLIKKNLIYVDGRNIGNNSNGHAWIIDGYSYCWENITEKTGRRNILFHCDWGWGGTDNGYYYSDLFNTTYGNYENMSYFSVKNGININFKPM